MNWLFLIAAGLCEIFYAAAMPRTEGFTRLWPSLFCAAFIAASMYLLSLATRSIPVGTAYAVWVGIGASLTVIYAMVTGAEAVSLAKIALVAGIIACVAGLKLLH